MPFPDREKYGADVLAAAILPHMPAGWSIEQMREDSDRGQWAHLVREEDGAAVTLYVPLSYHAGGPSLRLHLSGRFPRDPRGNLYGRHDLSPRITVAVGRPPETIAAEIQRRLLPIYLKSYAEAIATKQRDDEHREAAQELASQMAELLGEDLHVHGNLTDRDGLRIFPKTCDGTRAEVNVDRWGDLEVKVSIHMDDKRENVTLAVALAAWIQLNLQEERDAADVLAEEASPTDLAILGDEGARRAASVAPRPEP